MVQINFALREVNCKVVYYGPGRSGKTTNLDIVHQKAPKDSIGEMVSIATETDRTLFFDFLPLDLGTVAGMKTKFQLYTVPGQVYYNETRKIVLQGADGVVFVADSQKSMREENIESLRNLEDNLAEKGIDINEIPLIIQSNKRDLPDIDTVEELEKYLNRWKAAHFEAVAVKGDGVFPTLKALASMVISRLNRQHTPGAAHSEAAPAATRESGRSIAAAPAKPAAGIGNVPAPPAKTASAPTQAAAQAGSSEKSAPVHSQANATTQIQAPVHHAAPVHQAPAAPAPVAPKVRVAAPAVQAAPAAPPASPAASTPRPAGTATVPRPHAHQPASSAAAGGGEDSNPVAKELRRKRSDIEAREHAERERIMQMAGKRHAGKGGPSKGAIIAIAVAAVAAAGAAAWFFLVKGG